mmetsp:Transcript_15507/g.21406  ORF Transcript_15507/g.21406 Transcript_15507/m.21406 type:complete len:201 (+) Transcript_15507:70-672(+)|eukprot:CAMPEP_0196590030 /NCGR_PEP_ID=MMETSP1081-20130531/65321_1 /TAXON_ID=36882 /ORGANISM="Pyramimonas amylifera, Strain CCMP720" /LENGTH=200 /DNA_ID=CAMNT_0041913003 /DNA_START=69 /DNA_END=671 /DNA_ORIENTATION=+
MVNVYTQILGKIPFIAAEDGSIQTEPFLEACRCIVPIIETLGTAFYPAKADVNGNIERLSNRKKEDPEKYKLLFDIVKAEMAAGQEGGSTSATKGVLWLKRFLEFVLALMSALEANTAGSLTLYDAANTAYITCLQPYHGWIASSAFTVVLNLCGSREAFENALGGEAGDRAQFLQSFGPVLQSVHTFLVENKLDDPNKI